MVIKNIGGKIISFGNVMVLPGNTAEVSEKFDGASNVGTLVKMGFIKVLDEPDPVDEDVADAPAVVDPAHATADPAPVKKRPAKAKVAE